MPGKGKDKSKKAEQAAPKDDEAFVREHAEGLSRSTRNAKWIRTPGEGLDHEREDA